MALKMLNRVRGAKDKKWTLSSSMQASSLYMAVSGANPWTNQTWRAPMSACLLSSLLVIGFTLMSCVTLVK